jgi:predicted NUDIX family NTP pyrophosphohydrolase
MMTVATIAGRSLLVVEGGKRNLPMAKQSAGLLLYRRSANGIEVLLAHPGGPFWMKKDLGAWSIPKGEFLEGEEPLAAARREFLEEIGQTIDPAVIGIFRALTPCKQPSRKIIHAFAIEADLDVGTIHSNTFEAEWPPHSGQTQSFPEVDRAQWFALAEARQRIQKGQVPILDELTQLAGHSAAS